MIRLINETSDIHKPYTGVRKIEMEIADETNITELLEAFEQFLRASGYTVDGALDIVNDESSFIKDEWD